MTSGSHSVSSTEIINLGDPNIQCPQVFPGHGASSPASFLYGDIPVVCGGDWDDTSCKQLVRDGETWVWELFNDMTVARKYSAFAQMDQDWLLAGTFCPHSILAINLS